MGLIGEQIQDIGLQTRTRFHVGNGIPTASVGSGNVTSGIDYNHPLFLSSADVSGVHTQFCPHVL